MPLVKFRLRGDTAANWAAENPVLLAREPGLETDTHLVKYGDGTTAWNSLPYQSVSVGISGLSGYSEGTWMPVVTSASGSIGGYTSSGSYTKIGRLVVATLVVTITSAGSGGGFLNISLPFASSVEAIAAGRETASVGTDLQAQISAGAGTVAVIADGGGYPGVTGYRVLVTVTYFT